MSRSDIYNIILILFIAGVFFMVFKFLQKLVTDESGIFDFERDHKEALNKPHFNKKPPNDEAILIGTSSNKKDVFIETCAKHVFICGTTGSGKTIAISNFIKSGADYDYPMLIVDGKGDTDKGSLLEIIKTSCPNRKLFVINLNEPSKSDKYNPFKNTNTDVIKDMLINMTNWSEEHYKYNTERYIQRLCRLLELKNIDISLESLTKYLPTDNFTKLSRDLDSQGLISKEEHTENITLAKNLFSISLLADFSLCKEALTLRPVFWGWPEGPVMQSETVRRA